MQQELIEMLEEIIQYVEVWHPEDGEALDRAEALIKKAKNNAPAQEEGLTARQFDLICQAIDKADTITMEGDYMLDSDDCISVVRVMQVLFDIKSFAQRKISCEQT